MKYLFCIIFTAILVFIGTLYFNQETEVSSYADCIIKKMKDAKNDTAANAIKDACKKKFES